MAGTDADLKVGMSVSFNASLDPVTGKGKAEGLDYESSARGPVEAITLAAGTTPGSFTIFGQTITVLSSTVFEGATGLDGTTPLAVGNFVEVSGTLDPTTNSIQADRVEVKTASGEDARLRGTVSNLTASSFTLTIESGLTFTVNFTGTLDPAIVDGSKVRIRFAPADLSGTVLTVADASTIKTRTFEAHPHEGDRTELEGVVQNLDSTAFTFTVRDQTVQATADLIAGLSNGSRVSVQGTLNGTVLTASKIEIHQRETELQDKDGTISAIDVANHTITVGGTVFTITDRTIFQDETGVWTGSNPISTMTTSDDVQIKYFVDTTVVPNLNKVVKIERNH